MKWIADRSEDFLTPPMAATCRRRPSWRWRPTARSWPAPALRWQHRRLRHPHRRAITLMIGPWVQTSVYDIRTIDFHFKGGADEYRAHQRLPRRRPARGDLHHGATDGRGRARPASTASRCAAATSSARSRCPQEPMGQTYDTASSRRSWTRGHSLADWAGFDARAAQNRRARLLPGNLASPPSGMDRRQRV